MNIKELVALASIRSKKTQGKLGQEMGHKVKSRISKIASGLLQPDASEIVYLARAAKLPEIETLAAIEIERHPELAEVWRLVVTKANRITSQVK